MNETFIRFKIRAVLKKSIETEAVFTKTEMNNEWNINFRQNTDIGRHLTYFTVFSINRSTSETHFLSDLSASPAARASIYCALEIVVRASLCAYFVALPYLTPRCCTLKTHILLHKPRRRHCHKINKKKRQHRIWRCKLALHSVPLCVQREFKLATGMSGRCKKKKKKTASIIGVKFVSLVSVNKLTLTKSFPQLS